MSDFALEECFFNYLSENLVTVCDAFFSAIISPINLKAANIHWVDCKRNLSIQGKKQTLIHYSYLEEVYTISVAVLNSWHDRV